MEKFTPLDAARSLARKYGTLSPDDLKLLAGMLEFATYKKGECFVTEGQMVDEMYYIEKGLVRQFYFKYGKDLTEHIGYERSMIICIESYFNRMPTRLMAEALEPTRVWRIPRDTIEGALATHPQIERIYRRIIEYSLIESQQKADLVRFEPAQERYVRLLQMHPEIVKRAPLLYVASLLQMTPETLSRVRATV